MRALFFDLHAAIWFGWLIYWRMAAQDTKPAARVDGAAVRWAYLFPLIAAGLCFWLPRPFAGLRVMLFPDALRCALFGTGLLVLGMVVCCWARFVLGRNWSNVVTIKVGHELVRSGPYRWVRHPIYTGLLLAVAGTALLQDLWIDLLAVPLVFGAFWIKLRREEAWMAGQFGVAYSDYARQTARLIPFLF
jgi:protein-S-isoprenylcysteine O-methyltransferase Ste14